MKKKAFKIGDRFSQLEIVELLPPSNPTSQHRLARVKCDCGNSVIVRRNSLRTGNTRSCGCLHRSVTSKLKRTHGHSHVKSRTYNSWLNMKTRCTNQNDHHFTRWGGRGIRISDRWLNSFDNFLADMGERPHGRTLDRIDNNKNYEPGNCRWATPTQQAQNKSRRTSI